MDDETRDVIRAGAPGALEALTAAGLHALGADPITSAIGGLMVGTAWTLDQVGFPLRLARGQRVVDETASVIGSEAEVVRLAISNDQRLELTMHVLEAAARTTRDDKLRALGRVLANGLMNDKVDEAGFLTAALTAMEAPHIQVLRTNCSSSPPTCRSTPPQTQIVPAGRRKGRWRACRSTASSCRQS